MFPLNLSEFDQTSKRLMGCIHHTNQSTRQKVANWDAPNHGNWNGGTKNKAWSSRESAKWTLARYPWQCGARTGIKSIFGRLTAIHRPIHDLREQSHDQVCRRVTCADAQPAVIWTFDCVSEFRRTVWLYSSHDAWVSTHREWVSIFQITCKT